MEASASVTEKAVPDSDLAFLVQALRHEVEKPSPGPETRLESLRLLHEVTLTRIQQGEI